MISRDEALKLVRKYIKTENTVKHMIATEAIMKALAKHFKEDEAVWGMAGLVHDLDYEVMESEKEHGVKTVELLKKEDADLPEEVLGAILAHCYDMNPKLDKPKNKLEWSLFICDSLTGLIVASALVQPDKKLASVKVKSVMKKFKSPSFAAGTRREDIALCEKKLGIELRDFVELSLKAMQGAADELEL